jgi:cysteine desulfurase
VDLFSANASKLYGPKQVGFLYVKSGTKLEPIIYGGGQEKNIRSGTENVPGVVGLAESLKLAQQNRLEENKRLLEIKQYFYKELTDRIPKIVLNGPDDSQLRPNDELFNQGLDRLPNNLNVSILDIEGEAVLLYLDAYNIAASTGSACTSQSLDPSHVILAIGKPYEYAHGSIRFTLGKNTTKEDIDYVMQVLPGIVEELRRISPVHLDPEKEKQISMEAAFVGENMKKFRNDKIKK